VRCGLSEGQFVAPPKAALPDVTTHSDGAAASAASNAVPPGSNRPAADGPAGARDRTRPVRALDSTEAVTPTTSRMPRALTGS